MKISLIISQLLELGREIFQIIFTFGKKHPLATLFFLVLELWIHSLLFQHLAELKDIWQLIPFIGGK